MEGRVGGQRSRGVQVTEDLVGDAENFGIFAEGHGSHRRVLSRGGI